MTPLTCVESCVRKAIVESVAKLHLSELLTEQTRVRRTKLTVACGSLRHAGGEQVHVAQAAVMYTSQEMTINASCQLTWLKN